MNRIVYANENGSVAIVTPVINTMPEQENITEEKEEDFRKEKCKLHWTHPQLKLDNSRQNHGWWISQIIRSRNN